MGGCGPILLMFLVVALLLPGLCFVVTGLGALPSLLAGNSDSPGALAGSLAAGDVLVLAAIAIFRSVGKADDEDQK
jgi:hypothetical protein